MRNELKLNPDFAFMEKRTNGDIGIGTIFKAKWGLSDKLDLVVSKYDRPHEVTFEKDGQLEVTLKLKLTPIDSTSSELESRFFVTLHGFIRAIFPIFKIKLKLQESINMDNLKGAHEGN